MGPDVVQQASQARPRVEPGQRGVFQKGGFSAEDAVASAQIIEAAGLDILEISGGTYEQPRLLGLDNLSINPDRSEKRRNSTIAREAYFLDYAANIKKTISIPITQDFRVKNHKFK